MILKRYFVVFSLLFLVLFASSKNVFAISNADATILQNKYGIDREGSKYLSPKEVETILKSTLAPAGTNPFDYIKGADGKIVPRPIAVKENVLPTSANNVNCFDYYKIGSVYADITSLSSTVSAGSDMNFIGDVINNNSYPIINGSVYVKIFKVNSGDEKNINGSAVVDQFLAVKDISISSLSKTAIKFSWKVPAFAEAGDYRIATYFETADSFSLSGLSYSDFMVGSTYNFSVKSENKGGLVFLNKSNVKINGNAYNFSASNPVIEKKKSITITAEAKNTTKQDQHVNVTWTLYKWDALKKENLIKSEIMTVNLKANATSSVSIVLPEDDSPIYLVEAKLVYKDTSSILNIRYSRNGVDKTVIDFPSITSYPINKGQKNTVFACLHNSGTASTIDKDKTVITLLDKNGKKFHQFEYNGIVTKDIMGIKEDFVLNNSYDTFTMKMEIFHDGKLTDTIKQYYDCNKLSPGSCLSDRPSNSELIQRIATHVLLFIGIISLILAIIFRTNKKKKDFYKSIFKSFTFFIITLGFLMSANITHAKSTSWSSGTIAPSLQYFWTKVFSGAPTSGWYTGLNANSVTGVNINYEAIVKMADGTPVNDGDTVPTGSVLSFIFKKHTAGDATWSTSGYTQSSHTANWIAGAPSSISCSTDLLNSSTYVDTFAPLNITPPTKSVAITESYMGEKFSCGSGSTNANGDYVIQCTVKPNVDPTATISLNPSFNFAGTSGKFYYRYFERAGGPTGQTGCSGDSVPMRSGSSPYPTYSLAVPAKTINYSFYAKDIAGNHAPVAGIHGVSTGFSTVDYTFSVSGGDTDGDSLTLGVDWNDDGDINAFDGNITWVAAAIPSGGSWPISKTWSTGGTKTFRVIAKDSKGVKSAWVSKTITLAVPNPDFDFVLDRRDRDVNIASGKSGSNLITATKISGTSKPVNLSVLSIKDSLGNEYKDQTNGISVGNNAFSINPVSPTGSSNVTFVTSQSTPQSSYTVTVLASNSGSVVTTGTLFTCLINWEAIPGDIWTGFYFGCDDLSVNPTFDPKVDLINNDTSGTARSVECINTDEAKCRISIATVSVGPAGEAYIISFRRTLATQICGVGNWVLNGDERLWSTDFTCITSSGPLASIVRTTTFFVNVIDPFQFSIAPDVTPTYPNCKPNVILNWNPIPGAVQYQITRSRTDTGESYIYNISTASTARIQSTDNTDLISGLTYFYTVKAIFSSPTPPSQPSPDVYVTAPTVSPQCVATVSDFIIYTQSLQISVDPTAVKTGIIPVSIVKNAGGVDKKITNVRLIPSVSQSGTKFSGAWRAADKTKNPLNTASMSTGLPTCTSIDSLGKCMFEYVVTVPSDTDPFEDKNLLVDVAAQEYNNGAIASKNIPIYLTITKSIAGNIKMWLVDEKDKLNESMYKIKAKKGDDINMKWDFLNGSSFTDCKALLSQGSDQGVALNNFATNNTKKDYQIASTTLVKGNYYFNMQCKDGLNKLTSAFVFDNAGKVTAIDRLTITVTASELKEQ